MHVMSNFTFPQIVYIRDFMLLQLLWLSTIHTD